MPHRSRIASILSLALAAACAGPAEEAPTCPGERFERDGETFCVVQNRIIIEEGFECPPDSLNRYAHEGAVVCSSSDDLTPEDLTGLLDPLEDLDDPLDEPCPANSSREDDGCVCDEGFERADGSDACVEVEVCEGWHQCTFTHTHVSALQDTQREPVSAGGWSEDEARQRALDACMNLTNGGIASDAPADQRCVFDACSLVLPTDTCETSGETVHCVYEHDTAGLPDMKTTSFTQGDDIEIVHAGAVAACQEDTPERRLTRRNCRVVSCSPGSFP